MNLGQIKQERISEYGAGEPVNRLEGKDLIKKAQELIDLIEDTVELEVFRFKNTFSNYKDKQSELIEKANHSIDDFYQEDPIRFICFYRAAYGQGDHGEIVQIEADLARRIRIFYEALIKSSAKIFLDAEDSRDLSSAATKIERYLGQNNASGEREKVILSRPFQFLGYAQVLRKLIKEESKAETGEVEKTS